MVYSFVFLWVLIVLSCKGSHNLLPLYTGSHDTNLMKVLFLKPLYYRFSFDNASNILVLLLNDPSILSSVIINKTQMKTVYLSSLSMEVIAWTQGLAPYSNYHKLFKMWMGILESRENNLLTKQERKMSMKPDCSFMEYYSSDGSHEEFGPLARAFGRKSPARLRNTIHSLPVRAGRKPGKADLQIAVKELLR